MQNDSSKEPIISSGQWGTACDFEYDAVMNHAYDGLATLSECTLSYNTAAAVAGVYALSECAKPNNGNKCASAGAAYALATTALYEREQFCEFSRKETQNDFDKCVEENTPPDDGGSTGGGAGGGTGGGGPGGGTGGAGQGGGIPLGGGIYIMPGTEICYRELPDGAGGVNQVIVDCP